MDTERKLTAPITKDSQRTVTEHDLDRLSYQQEHLGDLRQGVFQVRGFLIHNRTLLEKEGKRKAVLQQTIDNLTVIAISLGEEDETIESDREEKARVFSRESREIKEYQTKISALRSELEKTDLAPEEIDQLVALWPQIGDEDQRLLVDRAPSSPLVLARLMGEEPNGKTERLTTYLTEAASTVFVPFGDRLI